MKYDIKSGWNAQAQGLFTRSMRPTAHMCITSTVLQAWTRVNSQRTEWPEEMEQQHFCRNQHIFKVTLKIVRSTTSFSIHWIQGLRNWGFEKRSKNQMWESRPWVRDLFLDDCNGALLQQTLISDRRVEEGRKGGNKGAKHHSLYGDSAAKHK